MNTVNSTNATAPSVAESAEALGALLYNLHSHLVSEAETARQANEVTNDQIEGLYMRGQEFFREGHFDRAVSMFLAVFHLKPTSSRYLYALGLALEEAGRLDEAIAAYMLYCQLEPTDHKGFFRIGDCLLQKGMPNASEWFQGALERCDAQKDAILIGRIRMQLQALSTAGK